MKDETVRVHFLSFLIQQIQREKKNCAQLDLSYIQLKSSKYLMSKRENWNNETDRMEEKRRKVLKWKFPYLIYYIY